MNYTLVIRPAAEADFAEAKTRYAAVSEDLGERFMNALEAALHRIEATPLIYAAEKWDARRAHLRQFPFFVVFRVVMNKVIVLGLFHERRDPALWQARAGDATNGQDE
jgi:ParE-like toxin of type II ParDE toxin-antitoxin system